MNKQSRGDGPPRAAGSGGKATEEPRVGMLWGEEEVSQGDALVSRRDEGRWG